MPIRVGAHTNDLAAAKSEHHCHGREVGCDFGVPSPLVLVADQQHHLIPGVSYGVDLKDEVVPRGQPFSPVGANAIVAPVDAGNVGNHVRASRCVPFDLRVIEGECALMVSALKRLRQRSDDLDVLLRHRPRSISLAGEACEFLATRLDRDQSAEVLPHLRPLPALGRVRGSLVSDESPDDKLLPDHRALWG
jgi:hypothetical protein